jgi:hypothetical protein
MKLLDAVNSFERSLVINDGVPTQFECDNMRVVGREAATELAVRRAESEQHAAELSRLRAERDAMKAALTSLFGLVEVGILVRDISKDSDFQAFLGQSLMLTATLQVVKAALSADKEGE